MIVTKLVLAASVAFLLWWYVVRPVLANWRDADAIGGFWARLWAAMGDFKTKAVARITIILAGVAPLLAAWLGELDLKQFLTAYPWAVPLAFIALGMAVDFLRSFGGRDDA